MKNTNNSATYTLLRLIEILQNDEKYINYEEFSVVLNALKSIYRNEQLINMLLHTMNSIKTKELHNKEGLTKRERQVLALIGNGLQNTNIANALNLSKSTIETHRKNIRKKLRLQNSDSLLTFALIFNLQCNEYSF